MMTTLYPGLEHPQFWELTTKTWEQVHPGTKDQLYLKQLSGCFGWHHWLDGHKSEWTPGIRDGQGGLGCWDSWGRKESDVTDRLNWTELEATLMSVSRQMDKEVVIHIHNGILLSHKKEHFWVSSNNVDEPTTYYTELSKSEREI